ncbi:uncharacterized protein N0V89_002785 [Didymosphaeria variabile]|uniref:Uncharacterized protein n=1 Tax=Didymosphaeria variabile TaxID=1932322 RepID=A0A9W9CER2_9PLEO|nr:uncharacterized protein N0V89_002785 [Didymosphaeria variabile]KAJ4358205.1 hypothetical protein N0V89_002785 [Didymosphaeria variabile]
MMTRSGVEQPDMRKRTYDELVEYDSPESSEYDFGGDTSPDDDDEYGDISSIDHESLDGDNIRNDDAEDSEIVRTTHPSRDDRPDSRLYTGLEPLVVNEELCLETGLDAVHPGLPPRRPLLEVGVTDFDINDGSSYTQGTMMPEKQGLVIDLTRQFYAFKPQLRKLYEGRSTAKNWPPEERTAHDLAEMKSMAVLARATQ